MGSLVAMLPITPGGLGIVEGFMVPATVALGTTHPTALLAVLAWRLLEYWRPLPLAAVGWFSLWLQRAHSRPPGSFVPTPGTEQAQDETHDYLDRNAAQK